MITTTISQFLRDVQKYFENVSKNLETVVIDRGEGEEIVIMSLKEYNSLRKSENKVPEDTLVKASEKETRKRHYSLRELLAVSDYSEPQPAEEREWVDARSIGRELI